MEQGQRHQRHMLLEQRNAPCEEYLEDDSTSLEQQHEIECHGVRDNVQSTTARSQLMLSRCEAFGALDHHIRDVFQHREQQQDRELSVEVQQTVQQHVYSLPYLRPAKHRMQTELLNLIARGTFDRNSDAFIPALLCLRNTSAGKYFGVEKFPKGLYVTRDFHETVEVRDPARFLADDYMRPVQYVLSGGHDGIEYLVIISPYEVNQLMNLIEGSKHVTLHIFAPRRDLDSAPL
jgi:hypothetical protein